MTLIHRIVNRRRNEACLVCRFVWWRLERDPEFVADLRQGIADLEAGRTAKWKP